jgi:hypothetical protein
LWFELFCLSSHAISNLTSTLPKIAAVLAEADEPWWIIGSAAVALHLGRDIDVNDVDVLLAVEDARRVRKLLDIPAKKPKPHPLFHSVEYFSWNEPPLPVEFMADFSVFIEGGWSRVSCNTRQPFDVGGSVIYAPAAEELARLLTSFGRPKDKARLSLLRGDSFSG